MTDTATPATNRRTIIIAAAVAVLAIAAALTVNALAGTAAPTATDYTITAHGNISAVWNSDTTSGQVDLYTGDGTAKVHATTLTIRVISNMPTGATCSITNAAGTLVDKQAVFPPANAAPSDSWVTATCSAKRS
jgi:hypothetical protein